LAQTNENNVSTIENLGGVIAISPTDTNSSKTKRIKVKSKKEKPLKGVIITSPKLQII